MAEESEPFLSGKVLSYSVLILIALILLFIARIDPPITLNQDTIVTYDAMLMNEDLDDVSSIE